MRAERDDRAAAAERLVEALEARLAELRRGWGGSDAEVRATERAIAYWRGRVRRPRGPQPAG